MSYRLKIFQCLNFSCSRIKFSNQSLAFDCISVDNDPHFVVQVTGIKESVCFDVSGRPGQVMQLIHDNITGKWHPLILPRSTGPNGMETDSDSSQVFATSCAFLQHVSSIFLGLITSCFICVFVVTSSCVPRNTKLSLKEVPLYHGKCKYCGAKANQFSLYTQGKWMWLWILFQCLVTVWERVYQQT